MSNKFWLCAFSVFGGAGLCSLAGGSLAGEVILRGAAPAWVVASTEPPSAGAGAVNDGLRVLLFDVQQRADKGVQSGFVHLRRQALSPQALPMVGNVGLTWNPASQDVTVHQVSIIRDGQVLDVLETQTFETLRREANLEQSMLDGQLTAVLQPAGLRVGDILDVAYTVTSRDPVTADHAEQALDLNLPLVVDQVRYRASWPSDRSMRLRAEKDWTPLTVKQRDGYSYIDLSFQNLQPIIVPADTPVRFHFPRRIELSEYRDWAEIAVALKPLYDKARALPSDSPLQAEVTRIRALSNDPMIQTAAALRLVQDEIRYVALMMGEGALTPATADETWRRRYGDCKAKTALLLALLDELGIEAVPAAVSLQSGDGLPDRLPMISAFDHVLVRAVVDGKVYWLDGTRIGDRRLEEIVTPPLNWVLPLSGPQARLERLEAALPAAPTTETLLTLDASAGLYAPVEVEGEMILRDDEAAAFGQAVSLISETQKNEALRSLWGWISDLKISEVGSVYDPQGNVVRMTMKGSTSLTWSDSGLTPPGAAYMSYSLARRPDGPFKTAPFAISHPVYTRQHLTLRLPEGGVGFRVSGGQVDRVELGHQLRRTVALTGDLMTVDFTRQSQTAEITAAEAEQSLAAGKAQPYDPPRIFAPASYRLSEADRTALAADAPTTASQWLDRAWALSQADENDQAVEAAARAIALEPENSNAWANRGVYRFHAGDRAGAQADLEKAVDLDPSERIAMNGAALIAMSDGRYGDAVIELSRALRQAPGDTFALKRRAQAYVALEQYDRALRDIDTLIAGGEDGYELKVVRAGLLERADRIEEADAAMAAVVAARPDDIELKLQRIGFLNRVGRKEQAETEMDALAAAMPSDGRILLNQAALKLERGRSQVAMDLLDKLLPLDEERSQGILIYRAKAAIQLGRLDLAAQDFATARAKAVDDAEVLNNLCWAAATTGVLLDQAIKDCDAALAISPEAPHIQDSRARVLLQMGDAAGALTAYDAVLAASSEYVGARYGRGLALEALGQTEEGRAEKAAAIAKFSHVVDDFAAYSPPTIQP